MHKLGPQIEAHAEVLQGEAGEDTTKQVRAVLPATATPPSMLWVGSRASQFTAADVVIRKDQKR